VAHEERAKSVTTRHLAAKHLADVEGELAIEIMQVGPAGVQRKIERSSGVRLRGGKTNIELSLTKYHAP
jgi:hypothetical protein